MRYVVDTSVVIGRRIPEFLDGEVEEVIVPYAVLDELEAQANEGREVGYKGIRELGDLRGLCKEMGIQLSFHGDRLNLEDIQLAQRGRVDALIREVARDRQAVLLTMDHIQSMVGEVEGIRTKFVPTERRELTLSFKRYFTEDTMSIHLKEGVPPYAKRGEPGRFDLVKIRESPRNRGELDKMIKEIMEAVGRGEGTLEVERDGARVVQLGEYRIAIAEPPFSDSLEITAVRPLVRLSLDDYKLSEKLRERLRMRAEGVLIAGPPGSGKTTFASSLAEYYSGLGRITKTMESPRDLMVGPEITQYGPLDGDFANTANVLLLVRPDYTIFDEIRESGDFQVFTDMRLAGVGMVGVIHASDAIDALQRFLSRAELGMIPSIIDTIIFIRMGKVEKVYDVSLVVKVPTGLVGEDLARPVVEIRDFENQRLAFDVYTFGNQSVVVPMEGKARESSVEELAKESIMSHIKRYDRNAEVEIIGPQSVIIKVDSRAIPRIIGKGGRNISRLEEKLGLSIDIQER